MKFLGRDLSSYVIRMFPIGRHDFGVDHNISVVMKNKSKVASGQAEVVKSEDRQHRGQQKQSKNNQLNTTMKT